MNHLLVLTFSLFCLFQVSCQEPEPIVDMPRKSFSYLALGDSYTIGEAVSSEESFPIQLARALEEEGFVEEETTILAQTGWRTNQLQEAVDQFRSDHSGTYEIVSLLIGVNNQFSGGPIELFNQEFQALLEDAIELAGGSSDQVFVLSIPDYAYTPFGQQLSNPESISTQINEYNNLIESYCSLRNVPFFTITDISRMGLEDPELVAEDGLHPSAKMYAAWVERMLPEVLEKVQ